MGQARAERFPVAKAETMLCGTSHDRGLDYVHDSPSHSDSRGQLPLRRTSSAGDVLPSSLFDDEGRNYRRATRPRPGPCIHSVFALTAIQDCLGLVVLQTGSQIIQNGNRSYRDGAQQR